VVDSAGSGALFGDYCWRQLKDRKDIYIQKKKKTAHVSLLILSWPWTRYGRQVCTHCLPLHLKKVLPDSTDLAVYLRGVGRVAVLKREAVGVVHELVAVRDVVLEETFIGQ